MNWSKKMSKNKPGIFRRLYGIKDYDDPDNQITTVEHADGTQQRMTKKEFRDKYMNIGDDIGDTNDRRGW